MDLQPLLAIIVESVSWVTEDSLWNHEWTETKVTMKENLILEALRCGRVLPIVVGTIVVLTTDKPRSHVREQRNKSGQIQG